MDSFKDLISYKPTQKLVSNILNRNWESYCSSTGGFYRYFILQVFIRVNSRQLPITKESSRCDVPIDNRRKATWLSNTFVCCRPLKSRQVPPHDLTLPTRSFCCHFYGGCPFQAICGRLFCTPVRLRTLETRSRQYFLLVQRGKLAAAQRCPSHLRRSVRYPSGVFDPIFLWDMPFNLHWHVNLT